MLSELVIALVGACLFIGVGYAGFLAGRDSAERRAFETVSNLRADLTRERLASERLREHNRMLFDRLERAQPTRREVPQWMRVQ